MAHLPWTEKYRPERLDDVCFHDGAVRALRGALDGGHLTHLLLHGPPGTGKTSAVGALARELGARVLELNASDERGVGAVRGKIKAFAQQAVARNEFKLVVLDEADALTPEAQHALRRIMEDTSDVTRFCLMCNYVTRIIPPLASRCAKFHFRRISPAAVVQRLAQIARAENLTATSDVLQTVATHARGDMRRAVTLLQVLASLGAPTPAAVAELAGAVPDAELDALLSVDAGKFAGGARRVTAAAEAVDRLLHDGRSALSVVRQLAARFVQNNDPQAVAACADAEHKLCDGADEFLQLLRVVVIATYDAKSDHTTNDNKTGASGLRIAFLSRPYGRHAHGARVVTVEPRQHARLVKQVAARVHAQPRRVHFLARAHDAGIRRMSRCRNTLQRAQSIRRRRLWRR